MQNTHFVKKLVLSLFLCQALQAFAEPFRVGQLHIVNLQQDSESIQTEKLGINDAIAIYLPNDKTFIQGIEIKMEIPEITALWRDCCAASIYENINPAPEHGQIDFSGNKVFFGVLPGKLSWIIQIPFTKNNNLKTNQYTTTLDQIPDISSNFVFLRLQQIMKGVPDEVIDSEITLSIKPLFSDKGMLIVNVDAPESNRETISFFVDEDTYSYSTLSKGILLDSGVHNISAISELFRTEVRTVRIEQIKTTELSLSMRSIEPTLIITAPEGSEVYLDDEFCTSIGKEIIITEGDHKVRFVIGDYEILRSISAVKGKTYRANLSVDLQISEDE